jgi:hypothetical protein
MFVRLCSGAHNARKTGLFILSAAALVWWRYMKFLPNDFLFFLFQSNDSWQGHDSDQVSYLNVSLVESRRGGSVEDPALGRCMSVRSYLTQSGYAMYFRALILRPGCSSCSDLAIPWC